MFYYKQSPSENIATNEEMPQFKVIVYGNTAIGRIDNACINTRHISVPATSLLMSG